jgi:hypothetical protein
MIVVGVKIWLASAAKDTERLAVWFLLEQVLKRGFIAKYFARRSINEINGCEESIIPIF